MNTFRRFTGAAVIGGAMLTAVLSLGGCPIDLSGFCPDCNCPEPNCPEANCPDCNTPDSNVPDANEPPATARTRHEIIFTDILPDGYEGTQSCLVCHSDVAEDVVDSAHWGWQGTVANIAGLEGEVHGKFDLINNFCIAVPGNEGRCTQCHPSYGWKSDAFDFDSTANIDCLICHDNTGTYKKHPSANGGGGPAALSIDGELTPVDADMLQEVAMSVGDPTRKNCGDCHFFAGGGDNVKHGDLPSTLIDPNTVDDVHMGGLDFTCQKCHTASHHQISGFALHSVDEGIVDCEDCHDANPHAADALLSSLLNIHTNTVHCTVCHIPTIARDKPTVVEWYWSDAGTVSDEVDEFGHLVYSKQKGRQVLAKNVKPEVMWFDGQWTRKVIGAADTYTEEATVADPIVMAKPTATIDTEGAKLYAFKKMIGDQPVDPVNKRLIVPHLFGTASGENPYWAKFDWALALADGAATAGQEYSGEYEFGNTVMYLKVSHSIPPVSEALTCDDCHGVSGFFEALGYEEDPFGSQ